MALGVSTIQGGVLVTGLRRKTSPGDRTFGYTTDSYIDGGTHALTTRPGSTFQVGTMAYIRTGESASRVPGERIYVSARNDADTTSVADQNDIVVGILGEGAHLGVVGPLTGLAAAVGSSGQVSLSADPLESGLPIVRYCVEYDTPNISDWRSRGAIGGAGAAIHESARDPVSGTPDVVVTDNSVTDNYDDLSGPYYWLIDGPTPILSGAVRFSSIVIDQSSGRAALHLSTSLPSGIGSSWRITLSRGRDSSVYRLGVASDRRRRFSLIRVSGDNLGQSEGSRATARFSGLGPAADGADGDVWVRDSNKSWSRSGETWMVRHDLSAGANLIRIVTGDPDRALGGDGDYAYRVRPDGVHVWEKTTESRRVVLMAPGWPYVLDDLVDGAEYEFAVAPLNLAGLGPAATVRATPTAVPEAPPARSTHLATSNDRVSATVDPVEDADVDWDYRAREADEMGHAEGFQRLVTGSRSTNAEITGLARGDEARIRAVTRRNPETAGPEAVVRVGESVDGAYVPPDYWDRPLPQWTSYYRVLQQLIGFADGRKLYRYHHPVFEDRVVGPSWREAGSWENGGVYSGDPPQDVVTVLVSATSGSLTAQIPRKAVCHRSHSGATVDTQPFVGENWRDYWHAFGEYLRFVFAGVDPDAEDDVDPDVPSTETIPADEALYVLPMHDFVSPLDGVGGTLGVGEAGEYAMVVDSSSGPHRIAKWNLVNSRTTRVVMALSDSLGFDRAAFHRAIQRGRNMQFTWSDRWTAFQILAGAISEDGRRSNIWVLPTATSSRDQDEPDVEDGPVDVRFDFAPPVMTAPESPPVPVQPASLVVTHKLQPPPDFTDQLNIAQKQEQYRQAGDYLEVAVGAPASGTTPFTYEVRLVVARPGRDDFEWTFGGPEVAGRRFWDGDPDPASPTWPNGMDGPPVDRAVGVDASGICIPRKFLSVPGPAAGLDINAIVSYVEVRAGNPDGQYGPFLRRATVIDGIP